MSSSQPAPAALSTPPPDEASTRLFLIESRAARLMAQSHHEVQHWVSEHTARTRQLAFLHALALGHAPPVRVHIQDLERYAPQWADLVPPEPHIRASLAHALSEKYILHRDSLPQLRAAVGLDEAVVKQAYQQSYGARLEKIFTPDLAFTHRLHYAWSALSHRLETLPPFWTAFALTLTSTVGAGILALPIAVSTLGPLLGIAAIVVFGFISMLTMAYMAEAVTRSGVIRYGHAYIGRVVADYLGSAGSLLLTLVLTSFAVLVLLVYYIGFSRALGDATGVPVEFWAAVLFLVGLYFLTRGTLNATIASSMLIGGVNIILILVLSALALMHLRVENLLYANPSLFTSFDATTLGLVFGAIVVAMAGQTSVATSARVVLNRDPSGRSLLWGSVAAMVVAVFLYSLWEFAVGGAVPSRVLAAETGTTIRPLANQIGPSINVIGSIYAVLAMGIASVQYSLALLNLMRERIPSPHKPVLLLPKGNARLLFHLRGKPAQRFQISLMYLGLKADEPTLCRFSMRVHSNSNSFEQEIQTAAAWDGKELLARLPELNATNIRLEFEILDATEEHARLQVATSLSLNYEGHQHIEKLLHRAQVALPGREALDGGATNVIAGERARFLLAYSPILIIFLFTEGLLLNHAESFTASVSFAGVLIVSLIVGVLPVLLLLASRRKGELVPNVVYSFLGNPLLMVGIYVLFLALVFAYGIFIWQDLPERFAALLVGGIILVATVVMMRRGIFESQTVVELIIDQRNAGLASFNVVVNGQAAAVNVELDYPEGAQHARASADNIPQFAALRALKFDLPANATKSLKVWAHRITREGESEGLPAALTVGAGDSSKTFDLRLADGQVLLPMTNAPYRLEIRPEANANGSPR